MRLLGAALVLAYAAPVTAAKPIQVGDVAPDYELTLIDKSKVKSADLRGQVVVLNFWATWCVPCRRELPLLDRYYDIQKEHGLRVFAVATENSLPVSKLKPLFAQMSIPSARYLTGKFGPIGGAMPTNYVIDRKGVVRYAKAGAFDLDALNSVLVPLLKEDR